MKLTPFGKFFIALVILASAGFIAWSHFSAQLKTWAQGDVERSLSRAMIVSGFGGGRVLGWDFAQHCQEGWDGENCQGGI